MDKKAWSDYLERLADKGRKLTQRASARWRDRWLRWASLGLMLAVTVGGFVYLTNDWRGSYQPDDDDFFWTDLSFDDYEPDFSILDEPVIDEPVEAPAPAAVQPLPVQAEVWEIDTIGETDFGEDPGPEPDIGLVAVMAPALAFGHMERPVQAEITSPFGWRLHPVYDDWRFHPGVDFEACIGQEVAAVMAGTVEEVRCDDALGNVVLIDHEGGRSSSYAHLDQVDVEVGQAVQPGQIIGTVGNGGASASPHLHFELRLDGEALDPEQYLPLPVADRAGE